MFDKPANNARRKILNDLADEGLRDPAAVLRRAEEIGPDAMLADLGGVMQGRAQAAIRQGGEGAAMGTKALRERHAGAYGRMGDAVAEAADAKWDDYYGFIETLDNTRKAGAKHLYDQAYAQDIIPDDYMISLYKHNDYFNEVAKRAERAHDGTELWGRFTVSPQFSARRDADQIRPSVAAKSER